MITEEEHYLIKLSEEASEIIKDVSKAMIFGLNDIDPNKNETNKQKIENEIADLLGVVDLLIFWGALDKEEIFSQEKRKAKQRKVSEWMDYSKELGITAPKIINKHLPKETK